MHRDNTRKLFTKTGGEGRKAYFPKCRYVPLRLLSQLSKEISLPLLCAMCVTRKALSASLTTDHANQDDLNVMEIVSELLLKWLRWMHTVPFGNINVYHYLERNY